MKEFIEQVSHALNRNLSGRFTQLAFDPLFLTGAAALAIMLIFLITLAF